MTEPSHRRAGRTLDVADVRSGRDRNAGLRLQWPHARGVVAEEAKADQVTVPYLDDRINTGRLDEPVTGMPDPLVDACRQLADRVYDWWEGTPPPIVYRRRTLPDARSVAFDADVSWAHIAARPLHQATRLLVELVQRHGFDVPDHWLAVNPASRSKFIG